MLLLFDKPLETIHNLDLDEIASRYGVLKGQLSFKQCSQNYIYFYEKDGNSYVLRICDTSHRNENLLKAELDWIFFLADNGISLCLPIPSKNGKLIEKLNVNNTFFYAVAFNKAQGFPIEEKNLNNALFEKTGRSMGRLHKLSKKYLPHKNVVKRFLWHQNPLCTTDVDKYLPLSQGMVKIRLQKLVNKLEQLPENSDNFGLIHSDFGYHNMHIYNDRLILFDFDNCEYSYFIADIAATLYAIVSFKPSVIEKFWQYFYGGYCQENTLITASLKYIHDFLRLRDIIVYTDYFKHYDMNKIDNRIKKKLQKLHNRIEQRLSPIDFLL
ncbi:phosphotransferase enzyme family protein [Candidatus Riflebacteria bacterium]